MARNISKKNAILFKKRVLDLIQGFDYVEGGIYGYRWTIETSVGNLYITLHEDLGSLYSVFMMFEDAEKASEYFDCNKYSGKHNIHTSDMERALGRLQTTLKISKFVNV